MISFSSGSHWSNFGSILNQLGQSSFSIVMPLTFESVISCLTVQQILYSSSANRKSNSPVWRSFSYTNPSLSSSTHSPLFFRLLQLSDFILRLLAKYAAFIFAVREVLKFFASCSTNSFPSSPPLFLLFENNPRILWLIVYQKERVWTMSHSLCWLIRIRRALRRSNDAISFLWGLQAQFWWNRSSADQTELPYLSECYIECDFESTLQELCQLHWVLFKNLTAVPYNTIIFILPCLFFIADAVPYLFKLINCSHFK